MRGSNRLRLVITGEAGDPRVFEIVTAQHSGSAIANAVSEGVKAFGVAFSSELERISRRHLEETEAYAKSRAA